MDELLNLLYEEMTKVCPESYFQINTNNTITYPYLTYDLDSDSIEYGMDGFYVDIDLFDRTKNLTTLMYLEESLKKHFLKFRKLTDGIFIRFKFLRSTKVPTGEKNLRRRNLQIYCKIDWRKING